MGLRPRLPESSEGGPDPCPAPVEVSRGPCPGSTGVLQASRPGEGGLAPFIPHHGPTSCTPHPAPRAPQAADIPPPPHTAAAPGALPAALTQTLTRSAHEHSDPGGQQCHALSPRSHARSVTPLHAQPWRSTPHPTAPGATQPPAVPLTCGVTQPPPYPALPSLLG